MDPPSPHLFSSGPTCPYDPRIRTLFTDTTARISAWPSPGGVIILSSAEAIDFEWLGLNPLDPPLHRLSNQSEEDEFCKKLLKLGAKWWDSEARWSIVGEMEERAMGRGGGTKGGRRGRVDGAWRLEEQTEPTMREKRLVIVGWEEGGCWVSEFDTSWAGVDEEDNLLPDGEELGRLRMCRTMGERCGVLRERFRGRWYEEGEMGELKGYKGWGFFNSWGDKEREGKGEVGMLESGEETRRRWVEEYYRVG